MALHLHYNYSVPRLSSVEMHLNRNVWKQYYHEILDGKTSTDKNHLIRIKYKLYPIGYNTRRILYKTGYLYLFGFEIVCIFDRNLMQCINTTSGKTFWQTSAFVAHCSQMTLHILLMTAAPVIVIDFSKCLRDLTLYIYVFFWTRFDFCIWYRLIEVPCVEKQSIKINVFKNKK